MDITRGIAVSPGIAIGRVFQLEAEGVRIPAHFIADAQIEEEIGRCLEAIQHAQDELDGLAEHVTSAAGRSVAEIFTAHAAMLRDEYLQSEFLTRIREKRYTAEFAVARTMREWRRVFQQDELLATRVPDLDDLERRLLRVLIGARREDLARLTEDVILVARDLSPSQTATIDTTHVRGIAIDGGGPTSHTAIIARAMGIPAIVGLGTITSEVSGGDLIVLDGTHGIVISNPSEATITSYRQRLSEEHDTDTVLVEEMRDKPAETLDNHRVAIMGNIESAREIAEAVRHGVEGIGLYRTEFLFLTGDHMPSEQEHYEVYSEAVQSLEGRPLIIRTMDLGADKMAPGTDPFPERNPFLGKRSIRYCMGHPQILRDQLRAIMRVAVEGDVRVMFPLVCCLEEVERLKEMVAALGDEMTREGIAHNERIPLGIMIEVPSVAVHADVLARHADFFSIGTNDLIQYTLAIDRANEHVAHMYKPLHPAVLRLIRMTADAAHENQIPVGLCGEMGSDIAFAPLLLGLGIDHFSVAPPSIVPVLKKVIRSVNHKDARALADEVLSVSHTATASDLVMRFNHDLLPEIFP